MKKHEIQSAFDQLNAKYQFALEELQRVYQLLDDFQSKEETDELADTARIIANSEFNKEDLTEKEIRDILSRGDKQQLGFWAMPLPAPDEDEIPDKKYIGKRR